MGNQYDWMHDPKYELFDDLNALDEITTPEQIHELLGDPIVLLQNSVGATKIPMVKNCRRHKSK